MRAEERAELREGLPRNVAGGDLGPEGAGEPVELHVLAEHALEQLGVRGRLARIEWEDGLLLATEVLDRVPEEGIDVRGACLEPVVGAAARGGEQPSGLDELVVVVVRQPDEGRVPFHLASRCEPVEAALGERGPLGVEVAGDGLRRTAARRGARSRRALRRVPGADPRGTGRARAGGRRGAPS